MLDQALVGSLLTEVLALASQTINKARCYISCRRDVDGNFCPPESILCGFTDDTLDTLKEHDVEESTDSK